MILCLETKTPESRVTLDGLSERSELGTTRSLRPTFWQEQFKDLDEDLFPKTVLNFTPNKL